MSDLLAQLQRAAQPDGDLETIRALVAHRVEADPMEGNTLRLCAIPRTVDQRVVDALWRLLAANYALEEAPPPPDVGTLLRGLPFARVGPDGSWLIHDRARTALLGQLRSDEGLRDLYEQASWALVALYEEQVGATRDLRHSVLRVGSILHAGNPERYRAVMQRVDGGSLRPAVDAVHVAWGLSHQSALSRFEVLFSTELDEGDIVSARGLLDAVTSLVAAERSKRTDAGSDVGDSDPAVILLARAQLYLRFDDFESAEELANGITNSDAADVSSKAAAFSVLWQSFTRQSRRPEALVAAQRRLALLPPDDVHARIDSHLQIAAIQESSRQRAACISTLLDGLKIAETAASVPYQILLLTCLAGARADAGDPHGALASLFEAFDRERLQPWANPWISQTLASTAARVLCATDPSIVSTTMAERSLFARAFGMDDPEATLLSLLNDLARCQRFAEAADLIDESKPLPIAGQRSADLQLQIGSAYSRVRRFEDAATAYDEAIRLADAHRSPLQAALALASRGVDQLRLGDFERAELDLKDAREKLTQLGDVATHVLVTAALVEIYASTGRAHEGGVLADEIRDLSIDDPSIAGSRHGAEALLLQVTGRLHEALDRSVLSAEAFASVGEVEDAAAAAYKAAEFAARLREWERAQNLARWVPETFAHLAHSPEPSSGRGFVQMGRLQVAIRDPGLDEMKRRSLIDELRRQADANPTNWWVRLNVAYAMYREARWAEAGQGFAQVAQTVGTRFPGHTIARRHLEVTVAEAEELLRNGQPDAAYQAYACAKELEAYEDLDPDYLPSRMVFALASAGRTAEATALLLAELEDADSIGRVICEARLGAVALVAGESDEARRWFERALEGTASTPLTPFWTVVTIASRATPSTHNDELLRELRALRRTELSGAEMTRLRQHITTEIPDGWLVKQSITVLAPDGLANVIASSEPLDESIDVDAYAQAQADILESEFPGYDELALERATLESGRPVVRRTFSWEPPESPPVTQIQLYSVTPGTGYTATATATTADFDAHKTQLALILESLIFGTD